MKEKNKKTFSFLDAVMLISLLKKVETEKA